MADIVFNAVQQILLCLVLGQTGQLLQSLQLLLANLLGLGLGLGGIGQTLVQVLFLALKGFGLSVQGGFLLLKPAFLFGQFGTALFDFSVVFCAGFMDLVLCLQKQFLFTVLTVSDGFIDQAGSLCFRRADFPLGNLLPVENTTGKTGANTDQDAQNDCKNRIPFHNSTTHLLP